MDIMQFTMLTSYGVRSVVATLLSALLVLPSIGQQEGNGKCLKVVTLTEPPNMTGCLLTNQNQYGESQCYGSCTYYSSVQTAECPSCLLWGYCFCVTGPIGSSLKQYRGTCTGRTMQGANGCTCDHSSAVQINDIPIQVNGAWAQSSCW